MEIIEVAIRTVFPMESKTLAIETIEITSDGMRKQTRPIEIVDIALVTQIIVIPERSREEGACLVMLCCAIVLERSVGKSAKKKLFVQFIVQFSSRYVIVLAAYFEQYGILVE